MDAWLKGQPWFVRLDEWQHRHYSGYVGRVWVWFWGPLCKLAERHHGPPVTYATGALQVHMVTTWPGGSHTSCTVSNCSTCRKGNG